MLDRLADFLASPSLAFFERNEFRIAEFEANVFAIDLFSAKYVLVDF